MPTVDPHPANTPDPAERAAAELLDRLPPDLAAGRHRLQRDATSAARAAADTLDGLATFLVAHQALCAATTALSDLIAQRTGHDRPDAIYGALRDDHHDADDVKAAVQHTFMAGLTFEGKAEQAAVELHALAARLRHDTPPNPPPAAAGRPTPPARPAVQDEVRCRRLVIIDPDGAERIVATATTNHASVEVRSIDDRATAQLYASDQCQDPNAGIYGSVDGNVVFDVATDDPPALEGRVADLERFRERAEQAFLMASVACSAATGRAA